MGSAVWGQHACRARLKRKKSRSAGCTPGLSWFAARLGAEGSGKTSGRAIARRLAEPFALVGGFFRQDRVLRKAWVSPMRPVSPSDGWCDDPRSALYNRRVVLPCRASHEKLWRADRLYDLVIVLDYNIHPRRKNRGSAIFLHCARPDFAPTGGCIALRLGDLRRLLPRLSRKAVLTVR